MDAVERLLGVVLLYALTISCASRTTNTSAAGLPTVVLNKGSSVADLERPVFILYDTGLVLFQKSAGFATQWDSPYFAVQLDASEAASIQAPLEQGSPFWELPDTIQSPSLSAMAFRNTIWAGSTARHKQVSVNGPVFPDGSPTLPDAFRTTFERLASYDHPRAKPWTPIEVVIESYACGLEDCPDTPLPWPRGWPDLTHPKTRATGNQAYRIYLQGSELTAAQRLVLEQTRRGVEINGKHLGVWVREVFPNEHRWHESITPPLW